MLFYLLIKYPLFVLVKVEGIRCSQQAVLTKRYFSLLWLIMKGIGFLSLEIGVILGDAIYKEYYTHYKIE